MHKNGKWTNQVIELAYPFFVKDLFLVMTVSAALLLLTGVYKLIYRLKKSPV